MADKFITPCELPSPYERELLIILMEECAEVQQRASKMLRFGSREIQPDQPYNNLQRLSAEIGDLKVMIDLTVAAGLAESVGISNAAGQKRKKLLKYMQTSHPNEHE